MKKIYSKLAFLLLTFFLLINIQTGFSQVVISGSSGATPDGSAMLDIQSNSKGLLIPRLTTVERTGIPSPAEGLLVYDSDFKSFFIYGKTSKGTVDWYNLSENAGLWSQSGSAVYLSNTTYNVGIGTTKPTKKLVIKAANPNDTLLEIQDQNGYPLMVITPKLTKFNFIKSAKGISGGFAVGRYATAKNGKALTDTALLLITSDSTRIYTSEATGISGGFAVGRYATAKGGKSYVKKSFYTNYDSTRVYTDGSAAKGISGGFAVGRYATAKGGSGNYMYMIPENYFIGDQSGDSLQNSTYTGKYNTFFGYKTGLTDTSGGKNVLLGYEAGTNITSGSDNVLLGFNAGHSVTSAGNNISIGSNAGFSNSTANDNIFLGSEAGYFHTDANLFPASYNIYLGFQAGRGSVSGDSSANNLFIGYRAGYSVKSGGNNVFLGNDAGFSNDVATQNVFIGNNAGRLNTSGEGNVFIGDYSGESNVIGAYNVFLGRQTGDKFTGGNSNVFIGDFAGHEIITGTANSFIGSDAGRNAVAGSNNIFMGVEAGNYHHAGNDNVYLGNLAAAGKSSFTGTNERNVVLGANAGTFMDDAIDNVFIGHKAGEGTLTDSVAGDYNVVIGEQAGNHLTTGEKNVFLGNETGNNTNTGSNNVLLGYRSGFSNTLGDDNVFLGNKAGYSNEGGYKNVFIGFEAGNKNIGDGTFQNGDLNVFIGANAGHENTTGYQNTIIGNAAGYSNTEGKANVFLGTFSGSDNTTGYQNIYIGNEAGSANLTGSSNIAIGTQAGHTFTNSQYNTFIGDFSGSNTTGSGNTMIGNNSGGQNTGSYNVFLGYQAGYHELGSGKLYIDNSNTTDPLIYGDFTSNMVRIGGTLNINSNYTLPADDGTADQVMKTDGSGNLTWTSVSSFDATTASNGLTLSGNDVQLGGDLTQANTTITQDGAEAFTITNAGTANTTINLSGSGDFDIQDNGTSAFFVEDNGNVGIGTTSPTHKLHVVNNIASNDNPAIYGEHNVSDYYGIGVQGVSRYIGVKGIVNSGVVSGSEIVGVWGDASGDSDTSDGVHGRATGSKINKGVSGFASGGTQNWGGYFEGDLYASGQTGLGTNVPATNTKLHVLQSGTSLSSQFGGTVACFQQNSATGDWSRISVIGGNAGASVVDFGDADDQDIGHILYSHNGDYMSFTTNNSEAMRIFDTGNIGIGTTATNGYKLNVVSTGTYGIIGNLSSASGSVYAVTGFAPTSTSDYAGYFSGNVNITGTLSKGGGSFKIDHPLDPANKYLYHSFVESPDMMNIYNGNVKLDNKGEATVTMPDYFEALNMKFRYQLTAIGTPGPNLYIKEKIKGNKFKIAGGTPGSEVSWQVTGIRHDAFANKNRIKVEVNKTGNEKGKYLYPEAYNQPKEKGIDYEMRNKK